MSPSDLFPSKRISNPIYDLHAIRTWIVTDTETRPELRRIFLFRGVCIYAQLVEGMDDTQQAFNIRVRVHNRAGEQVLSHAVLAPPHLQFNRVMQRICDSLDIELQWYEVRSGVMDLSNYREPIWRFGIPLGQHLLLDMWPKCVNDSF